jgi:hypothetical protein
VLLATSFFWPFTCLYAHALNLQPVVLAPTSSGQHGCLATAPGPPTSVVVTPKDNKVMYMDSYTRLLITCAERLSHRTVLHQLLS